MAVGNDKRRHVLHHFGAPADQSQLSDPDKLMNSGKPSDNGAVFNNDVAGKRRVVGENGIIMKDAVMGHMGISHEKIAVSYNGFGAFLGAGIEGHIFAEDIPVSDSKITDAAFEFFVLGAAAHHGPGKNFIFSADHGVPFNGNTGADFRIPPNLDGGF